MRPGVNVTVSSSSPNQSFRSDTGVGFVVGEAERGPTDRAYAVGSLQEFERLYGGYISTGYLWVAAWVFFARGGSLLYVVRVVGPGGAKDLVTFQDVTPVNAIRVETLGKGAVPWTATIERVGATYRIVLIDTTTGTTLQTSPYFEDNDEAVAWGLTSKYIRVVKIAAGIPVAAGPTALATGDDDRASIGDAHKIAAMALCTSALGPGQICYPGATTTTLHSALLGQAEDANKFALLDATDTPTAATIIAQVDAQRAAAGVNVTYGQLLAPWANIPGRVRSTTLTIPYSIIQLALYAANDGKYGNPNLAAAGKAGESSWVVSLTQTLDASLETLNDAGVTVARLVNGAVRTYGARTLGDPDADDQAEADWAEAPAARTRMAIINDCLAGGEDFAFDQIDGEGKKLAEWNGFIHQILTGYRTLGALYGATDAEAFSVDTGDSVNTAETITDRQLNARLGVKVSPFVEQANIDISRTPISA